MLRRRSIVIVIVIVAGAVALSVACGLEVEGSRSIDGAQPVRVDADAPDAFSEADTSADGQPADAGAVSPDASGDAGVDSATPRSTEALSFDGTDDFVRVLRQVQGDFTLEAWIQTTTSRSGSSFYDGLGVIYADVPGTADDFGTSILNGKFAFGTVELTISSTTTVTSGAWVHVAAVRIAASGTMRVLVNGTQEAQTTTASTAPLTAPTSIDFGGNTIDGRFFKGKMDEVRIWNVARTAAQIKGAMSMQLAGNEAGLVGYWRLEDGAGDVAADSSGSANAGSLGAGTASARPTWVSPGAF